MDPIGSIHFAKDTTLALLLEAQARGWELNYIEPADLFLRGAEPYAQTRALRVYDDPQRWHEFGATADLALAELDVILMRQDPPLELCFGLTTASRGWR